MVLRTYTLSPHLVSHTCPCAVLPLSWHGRPAHGRLTGRMPVPRVSGKGFAGNPAGGNNRRANRMNRDNRTNRICRITRFYRFYRSPRHPVRSGCAMEPAVSAVYWGVHGRRSPVRSGVPFTFAASVPSVQPAAPAHAHGTANSLRLASGRKPCF